MSDSHVYRNSCWRGFFPFSFSNIEKHLDRNNDWNWPKKVRGRTQKISTKREQETENESNNGGLSGYEQSREERIKANLERMEKLGILDLSRKLKPRIVLRPKREKKPIPALPPSGSPRRSSRLKSVTRVSYSEKKRIPQEEKLLKIVEITIQEGSEPEIYTEEHEKLLGDCKTTWTLYKDGYDENGQRIYDQFEGKSCHQCRQKTLGRRTDCSNCKSIQGQLCGDCLYMRYGENVIEANENPGWTCPICRGICNCSRCRRDKGWNPTGSIFRKVRSLGFKSVAHYLIQTRRPGINPEEAAGDSPLPSNTSILLSDSEAELSDGNSMLQSDISREEEMEEDGKHDDSDGAYNRYDDHDDVDKDEFNEENDKGNMYDHDDVDKDEVNEGDDKGNM